MFGISISALAFLRWSFPTDLIRETVPSTLISKTSSMWLWVCLLPFLQVYFRCALALHAEAGDPCWSERGKMPMGFSCLGCCDRVTYVG